jgi:hypothetical protein
MPHDRKYKFSGHQTFVFRYGWLEKGVQAVADRPTLFTDEDALVALGVGKNMVTSIRHWCQVMQLIEPVPGKGRKGFRPTALARKLLGGPQAWDQYMEDDSTLWLLHWLLVTNPAIGTTWYLLMARFHRPDFSKQELVDYVMTVVEREGLRAKESVVTKDVDCFLRTYVAAPAGKKLATPEETFSCPLLELNLILRSPEGDLFRFAVGPKPTLSAPVFAFALHQHFQRARGDKRSMSVQECLYGDGSPGQVFKLDENSLVEYVEALQDATDGAVVLDETAGLKQIYRAGELCPHEMLDAFHRRKGAL